MPARNIYLRLPKIIAGFALLGLFTAGCHREPKSPFPEAPPATPEIVDGITLLPPRGYVRLNDRYEDAFVRMSSSRAGKAMRMYLPAGTQTLERNSARADVFESGSGTIVEPAKFATEMGELEKLATGRIQAPVPAREEIHKAGRLTFDSHGTTGAFTGVVGHGDQYLLLARMEYNAHVSDGTQNVTYNMIFIEGPVLLHKRVCNVRLWDCATTPEQLDATKAAAVSWVEALVRDNPS